MIGLLNRRISEFIVEKLRNSWLLRALFASNLKILRPKILNLIFAEVP